VAHFKAFDSQGRTIRNLKSSDVVPKENGNSIYDFVLKSSSTNTGKELDVVFSIDTTGTMKQEINSVKENIRKFVSRLEANMVRANLCLGTFKDEIIDRCRSFVKDDPSTPENENLESFLTKVSRLEAKEGGLPRENALGGALDALKTTPWGSGNQRMIILITDAYFWFLPHHKNEREAQWAPTYPEVLQAIENYGASIFVIGPKAGGFNEPWFKYPSLPVHSGGEWFNIEDLRKGKVTLESILGHIAEQVRTTYELIYTAEDNGLDPTLPLKNRDFTLESSGSVQIDSFMLENHSSNMPDGRPDLKTRFPLEDSSPINVDTLSVSINGAQVSNYRLDGSDLVFAMPPDQGADIMAVYELGNLIDNVQVKPFVLLGDGELKEIRVYANGVRLMPSEYLLSSSLAGQYHLTLRGRVFDNSDPYGIRRNAELRLRAEYVRVVRP
jgi:hypothetical protein